MTDFILRGRTIGQNGQADNVVRVSDDGAVVAIPPPFELAIRGRVFSARVNAVTVPVNVATLVSVFGLYNPPGSNTLLALMDAMLHNVLATTVVNTYNLVYSAGANATGATFTTEGVVEANRVGEGIAPNGRFYSAVTHVGTPAVLDIIGGHGATTNAGASPIEKTWDGKLLIPPSTLVSIAASTAASTTSGMAAFLRWAEIPYKPQ